MNLLPYTKIVFVVDMHISEARELIAASVGPKGLAKILPSLFEKKKNMNYESGLQQITAESEIQKNYMFEGEVSEKSFKIERKICYRNSFIPVLYGTLEAAPDGTKISIEMMLNPFAICVLVIILPMALFGFSPSSTLITQIGLVVAIMLMTSAGFWIEVWFSKKKLLEIFKNARIIKI